MPPKKRSKQRLNRFVRSDSLSYQSNEAISKRSQGKYTK